MCIVTKLSRMFFKQGLLTAALTGLQVGAASISSVSHGGLPLFLWGLGL